MCSDGSADHRRFLAGDPRRADRADELGDARLGEPCGAVLAEKARTLGLRTNHADTHKAAGPLAAMPRCFAPILAD
jgi:hypothetical protein